MLKYKSKADVPAEIPSFCAEREGAWQLGIVNSIAKLTAQKIVERLQRAEQAKPVMLSVSPALSPAPAIANGHGVMAVSAN